MPQPPAAQKSLHIGTAEAVSVSSCSLHVQKVKGWADTCRVVPCSASGDTLQSLKGPGRKALCECLPATNTQTELYCKQRWGPASSHPRVHVCKEPHAALQSMWELQDRTCLTVVPAAFAASGLPSPPCLLAGHSTLLAAELYIPETAQRLASSHAGVHLVVGDLRARGHSLGSMEGEYDPEWEQQLVWECLVGLSVLQPGAGMLLCRHSIRPDAWSFWSQLPCCSLAGGYRPQMRCSDVLHTSPASLPVSPDRAHHPPELPLPCILPYSVHLSHALGPCHACIPAQGFMACAHLIPLCHLPIC